MHPFKNLLFSLEGLLRQVAPFVEKLCTKLCTPFHPEYLDKIYNLRKKKRRTFFT